MIEKILEFHCIVLDYNNYEIVLINDYNQEQNEIEWRCKEYRILNDILNCKSRDNREKNSSEYNACQKTVLEQDDYNSNIGLFILTWY